MRKMIDLADIQADPRAQPRTTVLPDKIGEYVEDMGRGDNFPALVVFFDGTTYWLADGFHRYYAAKAAERKRFACEIHEGGLREAILHSCGANAAHGLRRTTADKRRAVAKLLDDPEWAKWSDSEIARQCAVSQPFVGAVRKDHDRHTDNVIGLTERTYVHPKSGEETTMRLPQRPEPRISPDRLATNLRDLERIIDAMPGPAEMIAEFPPEQFYLFPASKLDTMARWLGELAVLWRQKMRESA